MIDAKELRIGNNVLGKTISGKYEMVEVTNILHNEIYYKYNDGSLSCHPSDLNPVQLTKELLIKSEFKKQQDVYWISLSNLKAELHVEVYKNDMVFIIRSGHAELILDPIKYMHQLQNLIFILTCKELTKKGKDHE